MQLLVPEVLTEGRGLTVAMCGTLTALGGALWLFGWRWHRFWIVAGVTLAAGLLGLNAAAVTGGARILVVGVLLALAAGMLALELARLFAFLAGGCGAWLAVQWLLPQAQELWAVFLSGGLIGLLLYRVWTMLLTSLTGVLLAAHAGLLLLEPLLDFDAAAWAAAHPAWGNGCVVSLTILGMLLQGVPGFNPQTAAGPDEDELKADRRRQDRPMAEDAKPPTKSGSWWRRLIGRPATT